VIYIVILASVADDVSNGIQKLIYTENVLNCLICSYIYVVTVGHACINDGRLWHPGVGFISDICRCNYHSWSPYWSGKSGSLFLCGTVMQLQ